MIALSTYLPSLLISVASIYLSNLYGFLNNYIEEHLIRSRGVVPVNERHYLITTIVGIESALLVLTIFIASYAYLDGNPAMLELSIKLLAVELSVFSLLLLITNNTTSGIIICCMLPILVPTYYYMIYMADRIQPYIQIIVVVMMLLPLWEAVQRVHIYSLAVASININLNYLQRFTVLYISVGVSHTCFSLNIDIIRLLLPAILTLPLWIFLTLIHHGSTTIFRTCRRCQSIFTSLITSNIYRIHLYLSVPLLTLLKYVRRMYSYATHLYKKHRRISIDITSLKPDFRRIENKIDRMVDIDSPPARRILSSIVRISIEFEYRFLNLIRHRFIHSIHSIQRSFENSLIALSLILGLIILLAIIVYIFITTH